MKKLVLALGIVAFLGAAGPAEAHHYHHRDWVYWAVGLPLFFSAFSEPYYAPSYYAPSYYAPSYYYSPYYSYSRSYDAPRQYYAPRYAEASSYPQECYYVHRDQWNRPTREAHYICRPAVPF